MNTEGKKERILVSALKLTVLVSGIFGFLFINRHLIGTPQKMNVATLVASEHTLTNNLTCLVEENTNDDLFVHCGGLF